MAKCKCVMSNACQQCPASPGLVSRIFVASKILDILPLRARENLVYIVKILYIYPYCLGPAKKVTASKNLGI